MPTGSQQHRAERRQELLQAALRALARQGAGASMEAIATEAGVTKPILYRHFGDRAGLAGALARLYLDELDAELAPHEQPDLRAQTAAQLDAGLRVVERHPGLYEYLTREGGFERLEAEEGGAVIDGLVGFMRAILVNAGLDPTPAGPWAHAMGGMLHASTLWWIRTRPMPREEFVDYIVRLLWDGLDQLLGSAKNPNA